MDNISRHIAEPGGILRKFALNNCNNFVGDDGSDLAVDTSTQARLGCPCPQFHCCDADLKFGSSVPLSITQLPTPVSFSLDLRGDHPNKSRLRLLEYSSCWCGFFTGILVFVGNVTLLEAGAL